MSREHDPSSCAQWMELGRLAELGLLSATLVHEIKQPLFALKALLQVHQAKGETPESELVTTLLAQVRHMEAVLSAAGGLVQRPGDWDQPFALEQPVQAAFDALAPRARKLGVTYDLQLEPGLPMMRGNPVAMQQVLTNILQNGLDAACEVDQPRLVLRCTLDGEQACIELTDNGTGISEQQRARIFEPFFTTKPPGRGTGLGLSIAQKLVRMAEGSMEVASRPGSTTILLRYPTQRKTS